MKDTRKPLSKGAVLAEPFITKVLAKNLRDAHKLLFALREQLRAMNCSASHAASWVEPRATATTKMLKRLDRYLKNEDRELARKAESKKAKA